MMVSVLITNIEASRSTKVKVKSPPFFTLVAGNCHFTNKPEADSALILPPLSISALFYEYSKLLKATGKGKKLKEGVGVTPGN